MLNTQCCKGLRFKKSQLFYVFLAAEPVQVSEIFGRKNGNLQQYPVDSFAKN
jgi:hypothetical protein